MVFQKLCSWQKFVGLFNDLVSLRKRLTETNQYTTTQQKSDNRKMLLSSWKKFIDKIKRRKNIRKVGCENIQIEYPVA